jgi:hypothetical protein
VRSPVAELSSIEVVIHLFHQQPLAAHRVQHLQQLRPQQLLWRNRRTTHAGIHGVKGPRHLGQHLVHHDPDRPQRMILPHPCFRRQVTEYLTLLLVRSSHAFS